MEQSYKQKFYDTYAKNILPQLLSYEQERIKLLGKYLLIQILAIIVSLIFILWTIKIGAFLDIMSSRSWIDKIASWVFLLIPVFLLNKFVLQIGINSYKKNIKKPCMSKIASMFESCKWSQNPVNQILKKSHLFGSYNIIDCDDRFSIKYSNTSIDIEEVRLHLKIQKSNELIFRGVVICIDSNKKVTSHTIITTKNDKKIQNRINFTPALMYFAIPCLLSFIVGIIKDDVRFFGIFLTLLLPSLALLFFKKADIKESNTKLKEIIVSEDIDFNKHFVVRAEDQIEARYFITTAFMDRFKNIQTAFGTKNIKCAFFDDKIMFAISTKKDLFEIGDLFTPTTSSKHINEFFNQIISIYEMIDYFKLAEKTGL